MRPTVGVVLVGISLFMLLGFFNADLSGSVATRVAAFLVSVVVPGGAGAALLYGHFGHRRHVARRRDELRIQTQEAEILRLAGAHGGRLTVVEIVRELAMTHEGAEAMLRSLVERGVADIEVTDAGLLVYTFEDIRRLDDKSSSRGVLDA